MGEVGVVVSGSTMVLSLPSVVPPTMYISVSLITEEVVVVTVKVHDSEDFSFIDLVASEVDKVPQIV